MNPADGDHQKRDAALLRQNAEQDLAQRSAGEANAVPAAQLLHELQVHQIELEMQNEALRASQIALETSRDRFVDLYELAPVGYLTLDAEGMIAEINLTATKLLHTERKQLLLRRFASLVADSDRDRWARLFMELVAHGGIGHVELAMRAPNGTAFDAQLDYRRPQNDHREPTVRITLTDVSERKKLEAELAQHRYHLEELVFARTAELAEAKDAAEVASRAKSTFLANMSHELRTPLNGVMGMTELAILSATDPRQIECLEKSQSAAEQLLAVISDVLDLSHIESGKLTLEANNFSIAALMDDVLSLQSALALAKGLPLSADIEPSIPDRLNGDALRLRQILINFTSNAIKFSVRGAISLRVRALMIDGHLVTLRFEVTDEGIGIDAPSQSRLFQAFSQADASTTRKYGGSGLGLSICKRLARLMGGDVGVRSQAGVGSTFWATAQLKLADPEWQDETRLTRDSPRAPARDALAQGFAGVRVLVADDDDFSRELAVALIEAVGLRADAAKNGREAVAMGARGGYALILMDVRMPEMSGLDATRALRRLPALATLPIIAMTANAFDEDRNACLAAGMNAHISKPISLEVLYAQMLHWLRVAAGKV